MSFKFKYLGEIEFKFENNSGYESGDQMSMFDEKTLG
jgi:hypothetical protein